MTERDPRTFSEDFRRFFLRGLAVLLPSVLTLWILVKAYQFVDSAIAQPINAGVRLAIVQTAAVWEPLRDVFDPTADQLAQERASIVQAGREVPADGILIERLRQKNVSDWWSGHWLLEFIGIVVAIIVVYTAGRLLGGYIGRKVYGRMESAFISIPVIKQVYPSVKQVVDFVFGDEQPIKFNRVVICEYPRKGIWSLGFMTGQSMRAIRGRTGDAVSIFIPSSPTPFTGYTVTVPIEEVIEVPISVDEALRFAVSGGVLVPSTQTVEGPPVAPVGANRLAGLEGTGLEGVVPAAPGAGGTGDAETAGTDDDGAGRRSPRPGPA